LDLGTPNSFYGGEGVSDGSGDGFELSNNREIGHALIIQNPSTYPEPDDYFLSDSLVFTFSDPVFLESITMVDLEWPQALLGAGAMMVDADGQLIAFVSFQGGADNCIEDVCLMTPGVSKLIVYFGATIPASGGIGSLSYVPMPEVIELISFSDACNSDVELTLSQSISWANCSASLLNTVTAADVCGNVSPDTCLQVIPLEMDFTPPDIFPPADITISCSAPMPAPGTGDVVVMDNMAAPAEIAVEFVEDIETGSWCTTVVRRVYRATDPCGNQSLGVQMIYRSPAIMIDAKVLLMGAIDSTGTMMLTQLNSVLPFVQPYQALYGYAGTESVATISSEVVDWILLELADPVSQEMVSQRAALLMNDGGIKDLDGISDVTMFAEPGQYFLRVHHRNHLDITTENAVDFSSGAGSC
ncbi:MAG: hypothetical protein R3330_16135, partial [Saprospiraceae bacterium]|nr:hypothetical protein [Saprospiraceae bacterium]